MKAYVIEESTPDFEGVVEEERPRPEPGPDDVLVEIQACSLNYRDLAMAKAGMSYPGARYPVIPLSDATGEVVEVGEDVERLVVGDRVATPFAPDWIDGSVTRAKLGRVTGGSIDGVLAEYAAFPADSLSTLPDHLSDEEGSTLSCAGLTAWRALAEDGDLGAGQTVLCLGTGGVSTFGLQFATMHGARAIVTSSSDEKLERARELGASKTINYEETPEWGEAVQEMTDGEGVDHVIEVGGVGTLQRSLEAAAIGGHVHQIGVLTGHEGQVDPGPILRKAIRLEGVLGVGSRAMLDRMTRAMAANEMHPIVDRVFDFDEVREAYRHLERGAHFGKVVVRVD